MSMVEITAGLVRALRERTDAPMMDCKKALVEANGDSVRAEEILRVRFGNKASKSAGRIAAEGSVGIGIFGEYGSMIEVNTETDFCARNADFLAFVNELSLLIAQHQPVNIEAVMQLPMPSGTVESVREQLAGRLGENVTIRRFIVRKAHGMLMRYIHGNKVGVLLDLVGGDAVLAKDIALHIAATKPKALDASGVEQHLVETERKIALEKAEQAGKPAALRDKIAQGAVQKFLNEVTLLNQSFVKDDSMTIAELLRTKHATVAWFSVYNVGEGIEKQVVDYVAEVAAVAGGF